MYIFAYLYSVYLCNNPQETKPGWLLGRELGVLELGDRGLRIRRRLSTINLLVRFQLFFM